MESFSALGPDGKLVFPNVEVLVAFLYTNDPEYIRELILGAVQSRLSTPGVTPIKRIRLTTRVGECGSVYDPYPIFSPEELLLQEELKRHVEVLDWGFHLYS